MKTQHLSLRLSPSALKFPINISAATIERYTLNLAAGQVGTLAHKNSR